MSQQGISNAISGEDRVLLWLKQKNDIIMMDMHTDGLGKYTQMVRDFDSNFARFEKRFGPGQTDADRQQFGSLNRIEIMQKVMRANVRRYGRGPFYPPSAYPIIHNPSVQPPVGWVPFAGMDFVHVQRAPRVQPAEGDSPAIKLEPGIKRKRESST